MLMARLSGSQLQAALEAVAINKTVMKLRTVIQFVKVCHWNIVWLPRHLDIWSATPYIVRMADNTLFYSGLPLTTS
jgi:hypothetical protein